MADRSSINRDSSRDATDIHVAVDVTDVPSESLDVEQVPLGSDGKNPNAVALGRLGGKKGGKARAASLTAAQRSEIARKAADARWSKRNSGQ